MLAGFKCPLNGENVTFEHCFSKCSNLCKHPLPVLMALKNDRAIKKDTISVTQILQPLQIHFLKAQHDYFVSPDDMMFATFGSAWHLLVANEAETLKEYGRRHELGEELQKLKSAQQEKLTKITMQMIHDFVDKEWQAGEYGYPESYEVMGMIADFIRQVLKMEVEEDNGTD